MDFALQIAGRYLRARRRAFVSIIGVIAIVGIALGVWALSVTLAITSGFQESFRSKVLGVNAHVLVLKYGWDFSEYREVMASVRATPGVTGAAPFLINPMMITRGERIAGVLVKGVDPTLLGQVLDLPTYLVAGSLDGLRPATSQPPGPVDELPSARRDATLDDYIARGRREIERPLAPSVLPDPLTDPLLVPHAPSAPEPAAPAPEPAAPVDRLEPGATPDYVLPPDDPIASDPLDAFAREVSREAETQGRRPEAQLPGVIIGRTLARTLSLGLNDQVRIISPLTGADAALVRQGATPRARDFRVVGIFDAGFDEYDSRLVYVDLWQAQRFFDQGDAVTGVEVKVRNIERARAIGRRIERSLGGGAYHTLDWESLNHNLFTALALQKLALSFVITIIIVIAAFNVIATLVMVVLERKREIAILKAMGAPDSAILRIFLAQGLAVGAIGTGVGLALGALNCWILTRYPFPLDAQVYLIRYVPVRPSAAEFVLTGAVAMLIAAVASFIPAWWASRLTPVEGLRYE
ncbi:MAG: ABC transporter permease [Deltaproteobacteria bacterium]|nr:ABC transporter permease [Deltaproteobacteria bacterium]MBP6834971.1 ABC transporter permease [Deltaproteobacteria bacterium]